jgi:hypothetical protein
LAHKLVTSEQLAKSFGVTRQRLNAVIKQNPSFPGPEVVLPNRVRVWREDLVLKWWAENPRRPYRKKDSKGV